MKVVTNEIMLHNTLFYLTKTKCYAELVKHWYVFWVVVVVIVVVVEAAEFLT